MKKPVLDVVIPCYNEQAVLPMTSKEFLNKINQLVFDGKISDDTIFGFAVSMYMRNTVLATLIVMVWNYFTKRAMLQSAWLKKASE